MDENAAAAEVELTASDVARLDAAYPPGVAHGDRYPEELDRLIDRD